MSRVWDADVELSGEEAARLIERQFPALAPARLQALGAGWDNAAFLVNERFVYRFPRRRIAVGLLEQEMRVLPLLAPHLPLPVPVPMFAGAPDKDYPYPFAGCPYITGTTACRLAWSEAERAKNAAPLGRFLAALHRIPVSEETRAWARKDDLGHEEAPARDRLRALAPALGGIDVEALADLIERLDAASVGTAGGEVPGCWVHGDLYARHLLVDDQRGLCGVIDWGDVHLGEPALDLMIAFSFLPPAARGAFREAAPASLMPDRCCCLGSGAEPRPALRHVAARVRGRGRRCRHPRGRRICAAGRRLLILKEDAQGQGRERDNDAAIIITSGRSFPVTGARSAGAPARQFGS
jgi:aminoglycoside phosphotransferase (APT) family kinase protein